MCITNKIPPALYDLFTNQVNLNNTGVYVRRRYQHYLYRCIEVYLLGDHHYYVYHAMIQLAQKYGWRVY